MLVIDFLGCCWNIQFSTKELRTDKFKDGTPAYRATGINDNGEVLVWWQPIDTRWW